MLKVLGLIGLLLTGCENVDALQGEKGEKGDAGGTGETGAQGEKGDKGATGLTIASSWVYEDTDNSSVSSDDLGCSTTTGAVCGLSAAHVTIFSDNSSFVSITVNSTADWIRGRSCSVFFKPAEGDKTRTCKMGSFKYFITLNPVPSPPSLVTGYFETTGTSFSLVEESE